MLLGACAVRYDRYEQPRTKKDSGRGCLVRLSTDSVMFQRSTSDMYEYTVLYLQSTSTHVHVHSTRT